MADIPCVVITCIWWRKPSVL